MKKRLDYSLAQQLDQRQKQLAGLTRMLNSVSPLPTMDRGFAVVKDAAGKAVTSIHEVSAGDETTTFLKDGAVQSVIKEIVQDVSITQDD